MKNLKCKPGYWWKRALFLTGAGAVVMSPFFAMDPATAEAAPAKGSEGKPNILVIWGDDVGYWNISHNNHDGLQNSQH